jgi:glycosyltransferase involved in cell wall biosynthesis
MKRVLIMCAHRPGRSPSQRYRFEQYIPYLESNGFAFTWSPLLNEQQDKRFYAKGHVAAKVLILAATVLKRMEDSFTFSKYDIIFVQREASFLGTVFAERKAFRSGVRVIFDFDDSIWLADTSPGNKRWEWVKRPAKFFDNLRYAHCVIAGNRYLAEKASVINKNVVIIPTTINTDIHIPMPHLRGKEYVTVGWSGSTSTVRHFEMLVPVLEMVHKKYGDKVRFKLVGDGNYKCDRFPVESLPWSESTEVRDLNSFDIGIMPLPADEWSKGKCGLKALSYMSCEVAAVLSAVGVNGEIIQDGNGFLAADENEWFTILCRLIEDKALREAAGKRGRQTVLEKYSVEANRHKYLQVFSG